MDYRRANDGSELGVKQPCYGEYYCSSCKRRWESIKAWRDYEQECTRCKILVMPNKLEELFFYNCDNCKKYWKYKKTTGNDCRTCGETIYPRSKNESQRRNRRQGGGDFNNRFGGGRNNNRNYNGNEEKAGSSYNPFNKSTSNNDNLSESDSINSGHGSENQRYDDSSSSWDSSSRNNNSSSTSTPANNENPHSTRHQNHKYFQPYDEHERNSWRASSDIRIKINPEELFHKEKVHLNSNQAKEMNNSYQPNESAEHYEHSARQIHESEVKSSQESVSVGNKDIHVEKLAETRKDNSEVANNSSYEPVEYKEKILEVLKKPVHEPLTIQKEKLSDKITNSTTIENEKDNLRKQDEEKEISHDHKNSTEFVSQLLESKSTKVSNEKEKEAASVATDKDEKKSVEDDSTLKYIIIGSSILFIGIIFFFKKMK